MRIGLMKFSRIFQCGAAQKCINLVDLVKSFQTSICLQNSASIPPRTSLSKFAKNCFKLAKIRIKVRKSIGPRPPDRDSVAVRETAGVSRRPCRGSPAGASGRPSAGLPRSRRRSLCPAPHPCGPMSIIIPS